MCWITDLIDIVPIVPAISYGGKQYLICKVYIIYCINKHTYTFPFHVTGESISVLAPAAGGVPLHSGTPAACSHKIIAVL